MKNLILLHLESLNLLNYRSNPELYPNLMRMEQSSLVFDRYFSTATSTFMVLADLLYGDMRQYECCASLSDVPEDYHQKESLLDCLQKKGYTTGLWYFPKVPDIRGAQNRHVAGFDNHIEIIGSREHYLRKLKEGITQEPFAYMICNCTSNLALNHKLDITNEPWNTDYWKHGYQSMDRYCGDLFELLEKKGLLENTLIVMFGDHGDDYWGHGMHGGLSHAIEPNNLLIRTPLLIRNGKRSAPEHRANLLQTTDLKDLILSLLQDTPDETLPDRKYVISRNAYAAQPVRSDTFNKAYSVSDGRYLMLVSSHGLEMYDTFMDPACQNDLLRFFEYGDGIPSALPMQEKYHFYNWWNAREQRIVRNKYYELEESLYLQVRELYDAAGLAPQKAAEEMDFSHFAYKQENKEE